MKLLGLDTSTDACTVGVLVDLSLAVQHRVEARAHTRRLVPMIGDALAEAGIEAGDLDAVVLGNGPGSFIGVRIGASVAQGIAFAAGIPLVPVSSLAAIAAEVMADGSIDRVLVAQDARMNEVYLGCYERQAGHGALPVAAGEIALQPVDAALDPTLLRAGCALAGAGWSRHPALREQVDVRVVDRADVAVPHASYLLACGRRAFEAGLTVVPERLEPAYVRETVAAKPLG